MAFQDFAPELSEQALGTSRPRNEGCSDGCSVGSCQAGLKRQQFDDVRGLTVRVTFFPPNNRAHDADGVVSSLKAAFDGIADVIGVDDKLWAITPVRGPVDAPNGSIRIELEVTG